MLIQALRALRIGQRGGALACGWTNARVECAEVLPRCPGCGDALTHDARNGDRLAMTGRHHANHIALLGLYICSISLVSWELISCRCPSPLGPRPPQLTEMSFAPTPELASQKLKPPPIPGTQNHIRGVFSSKSASSSGKRI